MRIRKDLNKLYMQIYSYIGFYIYSFYFPISCSFYCCFFIYIWGDLFHLFFVFFISTKTTEQKCNPPSLLVSVSFCLSLFFFCVFLSVSLLLLCLSVCLSSSSVSFCLSLFCVFMTVSLLLLLLRLYDCLCSSSVSFCLSVCLTSSVSFCLFLFFFCVFLSLFFCVFLCVSLFLCLSVSSSVSFCLSHTINNILAEILHLPYETLADYHQRLSIF